MTIDRKDSNKGYSADNCVSCCFLCNKLKSNFFTEKEFIEIAEKYVTPRWKKFKDEAEDDYEYWCNTLPDSYE